MVPGNENTLGRPAGGWRLRLYQVIWESDTPAGRAFDKAVVAAILVSVAIVIADSVQGWQVRWRSAFIVAEWTFTLRSPWNTWLAC